MRGWGLAAVSALAVAIAAPAAQAQAQRETPLMTVRADPGDSRVLVTLPPPDADGVAGRYVYATSLRTGAGSAELRLDRGMVGPEQLLAFRRYGKKVAVTFENTRFRGTGDAGVQRGARESFPFSIAAMLDVVATTPEGGLTVDLSPFLVRDVLGIVDALGGNGGGGGERLGDSRAGKGFRLAPDLSAVDTRSVKVFPDNLEIDAVQTYTSDTPGREVELIVPEPRQASFVVHHSFIRLPPPGFVPRRFDIRSAAGGNAYYDYGSALGDPVMQQVANRFRLEKVDPAAPRSRVKKPIVFYIDPAAPEPIRTALLDGVNYWKESFEKAGLIDAFRAEILPEGADPMDVRYNMVNWSNRLTRGWSYGGGIVDPRTGEIIKGNVVIGALRVRQDMIIFEGLVGTAGNGTGGPQDAVKAALARIRQLGAHEVGHAIGLMHNFAASTQDRTSVMDYPGPRLKLTGGAIDLSDAYAPGAGAWDHFTVDWLYNDPAGANPDAAGAAKALAARDLRFVTDVDGRSADAPSPWGSMWDDGPDPVAHLAQMLAVRRVALGRFGPQVLRAGEPLSDLRRKFVPVWLLHRYAVDAAGKLVGGIDYRYAVAGDGGPPAVPVAAATQRAAIDALVGTLSSATLTVPASLVMPLSSATNARGDPQYMQEVLRTSASSAFDPLVAADVAAQLTLDSLLAPTRAARLVEQHRRDPSLPGLEAMLDPLETRVIAARGDAVGRRVAWRTVMTMAATARDPAAAPEVAAAIGDRLRRLGAGFRAATGTGEDAAWQRHIGAILADEARLKAELDKRQAKPAIPPGMPIESEWFGSE